MTMADVDGTSRAELEDERSFLLRSLSDLEAERAVGDIGDDDYSKLRDRYVARAAAVLRALESAGQEDPDREQARPPEQVPGPDRTAPAVIGRRRRGLVWGALALFAAAAAVLVVAALGARLPGQTATGTISLSQAQQVQRTLAQAASLESSGQAARALSLYQQVLAQNPSQEQALAESGWLEFEAGIQDANGTLLSRGQTDEQAAERSAPGAYAPHLYLGSMLLVESEPASAATEFGRFLDSSPPVSVIQTAWPFIVKAYTQAGEPVPPRPAGVNG